MAMDTESWERECLLEALEAYKSGLADAPHIRKWGDSLLRGSHRTGAMSFRRFNGRGGPPRRHDLRGAAGSSRLICVTRCFCGHTTTPARPSVGPSMYGTTATGFSREWSSLPLSSPRRSPGSTSTGYQKGVSVGFRPVKYEARRDPQTGAFLGINFIEQELLGDQRGPGAGQRQCPEKGPASIPLG